MDKKFKIRTDYAEYYRKNKKVIKLAVAALAAVIIISHIHGIIGRRRKAVVPPRPVRMADVVKKDVEIYINTFGTLSAFYSVDIKSQVTGEIEEVHFNEGDDVKKGDLLFTIDPDPYKAELEQARATLVEDTMDHKIKKDLLERNRPLLDKKLISKQDFEDIEANATAAGAKVDFDMAAVDIAKINLNYCFIRSPIDGVVGKKQVDLGNLVTADSGPTLVNVRYIDNLYLDFTIPERELSRVRDAISQAGDARLKVEISTEDSGGQSASYDGALDSIDNTVDESTGTVSLRAIVPNRERKVWAGQFVNVQLVLGIEKDALTVPYQAVQIGQKGPYLFAVTQENKADLRMVATGSRDKDDIVIEKGVKEGEKVVTQGQLALSPGATVADISQLQEKK